MSHATERLLVCVPATVAAISSKGGCSAPPGGKTETLTPGRSCSVRVEEAAEDSGVVVVSTAPRWLAMVRTRLAVVASGMCRFWFRPSVAMPQIYNSINQSRKGVEKLGSA